MVMTTKTNTENDWSDLHQGPALVPINLPRLGSVSNPWLPGEHMQERDHFLEQGIYCTGLWANRYPDTPEGAHLWDRDLWQIQVSAPSPGVAASELDEPHCQSCPLAEGQHLIDTQREEPPEAKMLEFSQTLSFISQVCLLICIWSCPVTSVPSSGTYCVPHFLLISLGTCLLVHIHPDQCQEKLSSP